MSKLTLVKPVIGQPDSTEDVKINNALTAIEAWANGGIDSANLKALGVATADLAELAVTAIKIAAEAVTLPKLEKAIQEKLEKHYFATTGAGVGGLLGGSEHTLTVPANTLVKWNGRIHGAASGGTEGGCTVKLLRDGETVAEHTFEICPNGAFGSSVEVIEYAQAAAGSHAWKVTVVPYGSSFTATVDAGMLSFT